MAKATLIRMPEAMWDTLVDRAHEQGVSANQLMLVLIAGGLHFELPDERSKEET